MQAWLEAAIGDAERRGLPELRALLEGLAPSTAALRAADWNETVPPDDDPARRASGEADGRAPGGR